MRSLLCHARLRRAFLLLAGLLFLVTGFFHLRFDVEILNLLPAHTESVTGLRLYQEHFSNAGELVIGLAAPSPTVAEEAAQSLAAHLRRQTNLLERVTWQAPWMEFPSLSAELVGYLWLNQPAGIFKKRLQQLQPPHLQSILEDAVSQLAYSMSPAEISQLSYDPFGLTALPADPQGGAPDITQPDQLFASEDGRFRLLFLQSRPDLTSYKSCIDWLNSIENAIADWQQQNSFSPELFVTGRPAFVAEISGGMERDMTLSIISTSLVVAILFWLFYRQIKPLLWLLLMLAFILLFTLAAAGLILPSLNVVSTGFAAILLGLSVDYGMVLFQEHRSSPAASPHQIRLHLKPSILWSALTTGSSFLILNLSQLPGLSQLGTLVAVGILIAGGLMLYLYLPLICRTPAASTPPPLRFAVLPNPHARIPWLATFLLILAAASFFLFNQWPPLDPSPDPLRPRNSSPYQALDIIQKRMQRTEHPLWLVFRDATLSGMAEKLDRSAAVLERAATAGLIDRFTLPTELWARPHRQQPNQQQLQSHPPDFELLRSAALQTGFTERALALPASVIEVWNQAAAHDGVYWPTNRVSRWVMDKLISRSPDHYFTVGLIQPAPSHTSVSHIEAWATNLPPDDVWLASWQLLGHDVLQLVQKDLQQVLLPMLLILITALSLAFRSLKDVLLSLLSLAAAGTLLLLGMNLLQLSWNLINLMAVPLLLGVGVDYSIHVLLSLRRHQGDVQAMRSTTGRALLLCSATTATGFASLTLATNAGLASLGAVCALGVLSAFIVAVYLLPAWRHPSPLSTKGQTL